MRLAETVTFGGSGLNRAAEMRGDAAEQARLLARGQVLPIWRGKPLLRAGAGLAWVAPDAPVLHHGGPPVFLGLDDDRPCFATDISDWVPEAGAEAVQSGFLDQSEQRHPSLPPELAFAELRAAMLRLTPREAELAATAKAVLQWHRSHGFCAVCGAASQPAMAGWQRNCPACGAHHFPRTDPVVIMLVTHGNRALLGRSPGWPEGMYSCLAGFVEPGETVEAAVRREVWEEAGVRLGAVRYLSSQPWPFPASLMLGCAAEAVTDAITLDPAELEHALWVSREEMVAVMAGSHAFIKPARKGAIAHFLIQNWLADRLD
ncbi:NAD(+) diphosphatase [Pseudorhodobacter sp. MZDSW-24AT]|uniref:NAD(+) diphosphatase n=1 Tax=Pseudorhodobacter sp. MZDSW-24AT TaxID=2052957 RepID=UPI000C1DCCB2|nr:NAD(+) diphosphatase [Pseudorhodobacter sp. MZDSW-24AT]PJF09612.1 NAD(+) diphosphatase [Pseudorhodobacter sp. MZDSW-24AT]